MEPQSHDGGSQSGSSSSAARLASRPTSSYCSKENLDNVILTENSMQNVLNTPTNQHDNEGYKIDPNEIELGNNKMKEMVIE